MYITKRTAEHFGEAAVMAGIATDYTVYFDTIEEDDGSLSAGYILELHRPDNENKRNVPLVIPN